MIVSLCLTVFARAEISADAIVSGITDTGAPVSSNTTSTTVTTVAIIARSDSLATPIDASSDQNAVLSLFDNDLAGRDMATAANVLVNPVAPLPDGFTLNPDGTLDIAAFSDPGNYNFDYRICLIVDGTKCDTASITLEVILTVPQIEGVLYSDLNGNEVLDANEPLLSNHTISLRDDSGDVVVDTITAADGSYSLENFAPGDYTAIIQDANGKVSGRAIPFTVGTVVVSFNIPIDPSGVVYDSVTSALIPGAVARLYNSDVDVLLPSQCLMQGQQNQVTGADGFYRFDLIPGADIFCPAVRTRYRLEIIAPAGYNQAISNVRAPQPGALDASVCSVDATPGTSCGVSPSINPPAPNQQGVYFLEFDLASGDPDVIFNHVPLDATGSPASSGIQLVKRANLEGIVRGQAIKFDLDISSKRNDSLASIYIEDDLPAGIDYVQGSGSFDGTAIDPVINGRRLTFGPFTLNSGAESTLEFLARSGLNSRFGKHTNKSHARLSNGDILTREATASFYIEPEAVFDCSEVIGKVYRDDNRNGVADDNEEGVGGVRLATANGTLITVDDFGRFSIPCAAMPNSSIGSNFILKLDEKTLPQGYNLTSKNPLVVRLISGKSSRMNFGIAQVRLVALNLSAAAFKQDRLEMSDALKSGLGKLAQSLNREPFILELNYERVEEPVQLVRDRLKGIELLVRNLTKSGKSRDRMIVRTQISKK